MSMFFGSSCERLFVVKPAFDFSHLIQKAHYSQIDFSKLDSNYELLFCFDPPDKIFCIKAFAFFSNWVQNSRFKNWFINFSEWFVEKYETQRIQHCRFSSTISPNNEIRMVFFKINFCKSVWRRKKIFITNLMKY